MIPIKNEVLGASTPLFAALYGLIAIGAVRIGEALGVDTALPAACCLLLLSVLERAATSDKSLGGPRYWLFAVLIACVGYLLVHWRLSGV